MFILASEAFTKFTREVLNLNFENQLCYLKLERRDHPLLICTKEKYTLEAGHGDSESLVHVCMLSMIMLSTEFNLFLLSYASRLQK